MAHPTLFTRIILNDEGEPMQTIGDTNNFHVCVETIDDIDKAYHGIPVEPYSPSIHRQMSSARIW